jgi:hypothetical protein
LFPSGFSFSTTLTLTAAWTGVRAEEVAIDYRPRKRRSKVRLLRDGVKAVVTVLRATALRRPGRFLAWRERR